MDVSILKKPAMIPLWIAAASAVAVIVVLFGFFPYGSGYGGDVKSVFQNLWWMWNNMAEWEHCMFVPIITGGLIYLRREEVLAVSIEPSFKLGFATLVFAMLCFWVGYQIDIVPFSFLTIHLTLGALLMWFLGWPFIRSILFPFAFLIFAWPFPFLDGLLAFPLRLVMSEISHHFLNLIGIANVKVGTAIVSAPDFANGVAQGDRFALDVANPCSGIRSLFALTMVTALYAYFSLNTLWKQWLLFLCSGPLAIIGNFGRILMLTFGTLFFGSDFAIGPEEEPTLYHIASGFFVFIVALGGMVGLAWILDKKIPDSPLSIFKRPKTNT